MEWKQRCVSMTELFDLIAIVSVLVSVLGGVFGGIILIKRGEKGKKTAQDSISSMYSTYNQQVKDVLQIKDSQIKRLQNKIQQLEPEIQESSTDSPIELGALEKIASDRGINPALLKNPIVQKYIKKYTKGMGIEEIIAIVDQLGILKGNKQPKSETPSVQNNPNYF